MRSGNKSRAGSGSSKSVALPRAAQGRNRRRQPGSGLHQNREAGTASAARARGSSIQTKPCATRATGSRGADFDLLASRGCHSCCAAHKASLEKPLCYYDCYKRLSSAEKATSLSIAPGPPELQDPGGKLGVARVVDREDRRQR